MPTGIYIRTKSAWNKGTKGIMKSWNKGLKLPYIPHLAQRNKMIGDKNPEWRGDNVSYSTLHTWVRKKLGKIKECAYCGHGERIQWASISHRAKRDLNDYIPLCSKCHGIYDRGYKKYRKAVI